MWSPATTGRHKTVPCGIIAVMRTLDGYLVIGLSLNLPGPLATARLAEMGARVVKVEPPGGDPAQRFSARLYSGLNDCKEVVRLDLKTEPGQREMRNLLADADLLLTAFRATALERLKLGWSLLNPEFPRLCHVGIIGFPEERMEQSGHDLTYQAAAGLLDPPRLPRSLIADVAGGERAVSAALALLLSRERSGKGGQQWVSLFEAAEPFRLPLRHGLTVAGALLGGGLPRYALYRAADGWVALGAVEDRLWEEFLEAVGRADLLKAADEVVRAELEKLFRTRGVDEWQGLALEHSLALEKVKV